MDCREFQDVIIASALAPKDAASPREGIAADGDAGSGDLGPPAQDHLAACATCQSFQSRLRSQVAALSRLERRAVPNELEGAVVAALNAGFLQERVLNRLEELPRMSAPAELDEFVALALQDPKAPRVLDRLVEEDLQDSTKALVHRFLDKLPRYRAPEVLRERVRQVLDGGFRGFGTRRWPLRAGLAAAAVLVLWVGTLQLRGTSEREAMLRAGYSFEIVRVAPGKTRLDAVSRGLIDVFAGGILEGAAR